MDGVKNERVKIKNKKGLLSLDIVSYALKVSVNGVL